MFPTSGSCRRKPNPPFGQIPRSFFTGEPGYDKFEQEQWAAGYLFEHKVDQVWKVRQNLRYSEIDVDYKQVTQPQRPR